MEDFRTRTDHEHCRNVSSVHAHGDDRTAPDHKVAVKTDEVFSGKTRFYFASKIDSRTYMFY